MQASRLLSILILLQVRRRVSAEALAAEFEVSVRTIYRDIDQLSAAGVPVYSERGRSGGFQLMDGYRTQLTGFSAEEADALMLTGAGNAAEALGLSAGFSQARLKLLASLPPDSAARADRVSARVHLDTSAWHGAAAEPDHLPALASAVWQDRCIRIEYESWKALVTRRLEPLGLVLKASAWYLVAREDQAPRTYRVSNIRRLEILGDTFRRPARFDLARYWRRAADEFEASLLTGHADIAVSPLGLVWLKDVNARAAAVMAKDGKPYGREGWRRARVPAETSRFATLRWLSLGDEIKILGPKALQSALRDEAARVAGAYS